MEKDLDARSLLLIHHRIMLALSFDCNFAFVVLLFAHRDRGQGLVEGFCFWLAVLCIVPISVVGKAKGPTYGGRLLGIGGIWLL